MAGEARLALRHTPRRLQQLGVDESSKTSGPASQRKSPRSSAARKSVTEARTPRTRGRPARNKARVSESAAAAAAVAAASASARMDDTADDSITLVDETDDSITVLDFDIPISSSRAPASTDSTPTGVSKRKRRTSITTSSSPSGGNSAIKKVRRQRARSTADNNNNTSMVHVVPLRTQILDDHIKRRIRRNGLSEEMNEAYSEKRARRNRTLAELRRARDDLRSRDAEIERLRELTAVFDGVSGHNDSAEDASRVQDLEKELARLREMVTGRQQHHDDVPSSSPPVRVDDDDDDDWGMPGGMSDHDSDVGGDFAHDYEDEFGDSSVAELESGGTPEHHRHQQLPSRRRPSALHLHGPALTPPSTSPAKLPSSPLQQIDSSSGSTTMAATMTSTCDAGVQAATVSADAASQVCISDPAVGALQSELSNLRSEIASLNDAVQDRDSLQARMREKLVQHQLSPSSAHDHTGEDQDVELQLDIVLQDLGEKTTRLAALSSLLMSPPTDSTITVDEKEMTAQLTSTLHSVRQALQDLSPHTALPPSTAETLALAATRLRELDATVRQRTADLEASRAAEGLLRAQLGDRDAAISQRDRQLAEGEARAAALRQDALHLGGTAGLLRDEVAALREELGAARDDAALQRDAAVAEAEARLAAAVTAQLAAVEALGASEGEAAALRAEVARLGGLLAEARGTVARLREGAGREREAARGAVGAMRAELLRALQVGEGFLGGEAVAKVEEGSVAGGVAPVAEVDKSARGRSDDSGLGLLE
ncbi:hypothetical protein diail_9028 [Diaporthe ilicicola]|nr:hypothetical protein diail_9028 [Diaporthe ilicicola]